MTTHTHKLLKILDGLSIRQAIYQLGSAMLMVCKSTEDPEVHRVTANLLRDLANDIELRGLIKK